MADEPPIWRQAINDQKHPLHQAAWALFSESISLKYADRALLDQRDAVIDLVFAVLDCEELYNEASLGSGWAPINAVVLLGHWQVVEAVPRLLTIIEEDDWDTVVHDKTIFALRDMGSAIIDDLIAFGERADSEQVKITTASILADAGRGNPIVFDWMITVFDRQRDEIDIGFMAENLLLVDPDRAISFLEGCMRSRKYSKSLRIRLEKYIDDVEHGRWANL